MATPRVLPLSLCTLLTLAAACRDEQAGPRQRKTAASARSGAGGVQTLEAAPSDLSFRSGGSWGQGGPQYLGAKVSPADARAGQSVTVSHYFIARTPPPRGWEYFVHAVDAESGQMVANLDHPLQEGRASLEAWPLGKVIEDRHTFTVPKSPSGRVRLMLGFWRGDQRLPIANPGASDGEQRMRGPVLGEGGTAALPEYHVARAPRPPTIDEVINPAGGRRPRRCHWSAASMGGLPRCAPWRDCSGTTPISTWPSRTRTATSGARCARTTRRSTRRRWWRSSSTPTRMDGPTTSCR